MVGAMVAGQAGPAAADVPGYEIVIATSAPASMNNPQTATAECPNGQFLVGAAGSASGGNFSSQGVPLGQSTGLEYIRPDVSAQSVEVQGRVGQNGANRNWFVTATAVCADPGAAPGLYLVEEVQSSGTGSSVSATAECDPNDRLLSAGFEFTGAPGRIHLTALRLTETGVTAKGREDSGHTTASWDVKAIAICAPLDPTQTDLESHAGTTNSDTHQETLDCDTGFQVTGAGGSVTPEPGAADYIQLTSLRIAELSSISPPPNFAQAYSGEADPSTTANSTLTGYVICADLSP